MDACGLVPMDACGYQWIATDTYGYPWMLMNSLDAYGYQWDRHCYLWRPMDTIEWSLVIVDARGYQWIAIGTYGGS